MKLGVYRHYKGPTYLVLGVAHDANADELMDKKVWLEDQWDPSFVNGREVVVYVGLERSDKSGPPMAVRSFNDFNELICVDTTCTQYGKHTGLVMLNAAQNTAMCRECSNWYVRRFTHVEDT